ncbi:HNH endonuclease [compost metagenome]
MKTCTNCKKIYEDVELNFYKNKRTKDGFESWCKKCKLNYQNEYRMRPEVRESILEYKRAWREENIEEVNRRAREWIRCNNKKWKEYRKSWGQDNPDKLLAYSIAHRKHDITEKEWEHCKDYFNQSCAYCGFTYIEHKELYGQGLHKEHVDHIGANDLSNCVPSCKNCNSQKWIFPIHEWYNELNSNYNEKRLDRLTAWLKEDYKQFIKIR